MSPIMMSGFKWPLSISLLSLREVWTTMPALAAGLEVILKPMLSCQTHKAIEGM